MIDMKLIAALFILSVLPLQSQTGVNANQVVCPVSIVPLAAITIPAAPGTPGGSRYMRIVCVQLDPTSFRIDLTNPNAPTLKFVGANNADAEVPGGPIDGSNLSFTLAHVPNPLLSLRLYRNGIMLTQGVDYTINVTTGSIGFIIGAQPVTGDSLLAFYRY